MNRAVVSSHDMPLLSWPEHVKIDGLQMQRQTLIERISKLPRHSHKRIELEMRLRAATAEQLQLSAQTFQAKGSGK